MSERSGGRPSSRPAILEAAERIARRDGPGAVTVDAVVREAGISRGGFLYHFPTKLDLIRALVDSDIRHFTSALVGTDESTEARPGTPSDRLRVYIESCAAQPGQRDYAALIVAMAEDPDTAQSWVDLQRHLDQLDVDQTTDGDVQPIVARLALDGLWLSNLVDPDRFTAEQVDRIIAALWPRTTTEHEEDA